MDSILIKTLAAVILGFVISAVLGKYLVPALRRWKAGQAIKEDGPTWHMSKQGTPTMGGLMFIFGILAGTLAFSLSATELVLPALLCTVGFALVGFLDDFLKVRCKNTVGLRAYQKIIAQFLIEAAMICSIGGLIGIAIGYVGTMVAGKLLLSTTTDVLLPSPIITLGAFLFSVALGVIFGMYPAVKASGLQPVVALRAE